MCLAEPLQALALIVAHLLVSRRGEDEVTFRPEALTGERRDGDGARRHLALHVQGAAAPDAAVPQLP